MSAPFPDLSDSYAAAPKVQHRALEGGTVLLDLASGRYFELNATGRRIWELFDGGSSLARVLDRLVVEFDAPREELADDLVALVAELDREGLLRRLPRIGR